MAMFWGQFGHFTGQFWPILGFKAKNTYKWKDLGPIFACESKYVKPLSDAISWPEPNFAVRVTHRRAKFGQKCPENA